ncbi:hypothetical protein J1N35_035113 [Gossypium stocksii]|uniref:Uncharacterized protein n=1 Tax=Gossypium stocksii TaxID=47602 RepID=A0A9D3UTA6_9ROSI|nr:hypothetical protein J1N35_035113 [Gossypium stocksii]
MDLALRRSLQKNFTKLIPDVSVFPATLFPFFDVVKEHTQTVVEEPTQSTAEEPKKMTSFNIKNDEKEEKDDIAIIATTKVKDLVPPLLPTFIIAQDPNIDCLIDELMEADKEEEEMNPPKEEMAV